MSKAKTASYSSAEFKAMQAKGRTDWKRVRGMTDAQLTANAKSDADNPLLKKADLARAVVVARGRPLKAEAERKQPVTIRLSPDVLAFYKAMGRGWQGCIDADLRKRAQLAAGVKR